MCTVKGLRRRVDFLTDWEACGKVHNIVNLFPNDLRSFLCFVSIKLL
jgi:hypothetical protein